jgi:HD superfamily phosphodiesterase
MDLNDLKVWDQWFHAYVADFYTGDAQLDHAIRLKEAHTMRVRNEIIDLANALHLSAADRILAEAMALFHDIGRFQQVIQYGTFIDRRSVNHALLGIRQLMFHHVLKNCTREERHLIVKAIAVHNRATLPQETDERTLMFMRLLRDADKLDIWKVALTEYEETKEGTDRFVGLGLPDREQCSEKVLTALARHEIVKIEDVETLCDLKLLQIGWVFDLNYIPSLRQVKRRQYVERIAFTLPASKKIKTALHHVMACMDAILKKADESDASLQPVMALKAVL